MGWTARSYEAYMNVRNRSCNNIHKGFAPNVDMERYNMLSNFGEGIFEMDAIEVEKIRIIQSVVDAKSSNDRENAQR